MSQDLSFADLMTRLRDGHEDAATVVFNEYTQRLIGLAYRHLDARLRQKLDPEDVVQSALKSFFVRHGNGQFELGDRAGLWALLVEITLRKCGRWHERFHTQRRCLPREQSLLVDSDTSSSGWEPEADGPTPVEGLLLAEILERLTRGLDERERQVLQFRQAGHDVHEISRIVGRSEFWVYRVLAEIQKRLERMRDEAV